MRDEKILITGARGFIGKNLTLALRRAGYTDLCLYDVDNTREDLDSFCSDCTFVFHLAGVNRPKDPGLFYSGNSDFSATLLRSLKKRGNHCPIVVSSSVQAALDNDYGRSKKMAEDLFFQNEDNPAALFRLYGVFGKWARPDYNTVVATFMYHIIRGEEVTIRDCNRQLTLCYIDDVIAHFMSLLESKEAIRTGFYTVDTLHTLTLGQLYEKIKGFCDNRKTLVMPSLGTLLDQRLYGTYLSYLDPGDFSYKLDKKEDDRGYLSEFLKSLEGGQIFISTTHPGITRGNHWHHTKAEKFFVINGRARISLRNMDTGETSSYDVCGQEPTVVDIPVGYTHNITNTGDSDMVCLFWSSQIFDPSSPDTYYAEV